jgi:hypothetical protein
MARPPYVPTAADRKLVLALVGFGIHEDQICSRIVNPMTGKPITGKTLRKHFRSEIDTGAVTATAAVANNLFRMATGQGREAVTAAIFWMKARAGWRTVDRDADEAPGGLTINIVRFTPGPAPIDVTPPQQRLPDGVSVRKFTDAAAQ